MNCLLGPGLTVGSAQKILDLHGIRVFYDLKPFKDSDGVLIEYYTAKVVCGEVDGEDWVHSVKLDHNRTKVLAVLSPEAPNCLLL